MDETQTQQPKNKNGIHTGLVVAVVLVVLVIAGGVGYKLYKKHLAQQTQMQPVAAKPTAVPTQVIPTGTLQKLQDSEDAKNAYKIFPGALTQDAKQALTGFDMQTKQLPAGTMQITLVAKKQGYTTQTVSVKQGQSVYFIEKTLFDDKSDTDEDNNLHDDKAIIVDQNGFIIND